MDLSGRSKVRKKETSFSLVEFSFEATELKNKVVVYREKRGDKKTNKGSMGGKGLDLILKREKIYVEKRTSWIILIEKIWRRVERCLDVALQRQQGKNQTHRDKGRKLA